MSYEEQNCEKCGGYLPSSKAYTIPCPLCATENINQIFINMSEDEVLEAILMEGDRQEAHDQDVAFMVHWERKGEHW